MKGASVQPSKYSGAASARVDGANGRQLVFARLAADFRLDQLSADRPLIRSERQDRGRAPAEVEKRRGDRRLDLSHARRHASAQAHAGFIIVPPQQQPLWQIVECDDAAAFPRALVQEQAPPAHGAR